MTMTTAMQIEGRQAFTDALRAALTSLPAHHPMTVWWVDEQFVGWPLDEAPVIDALTAWLRRAGRRLEMIGGDFESVAKHYTRFDAWRRDFSHVIDIWHPVAATTGDLSATLLTESAAIELLDRDRWRARVVTDTLALRALSERLESLLRRCEPTWPATTLGL